MIEVEEEGEKGAILEKRPGYSRIRGTVVWYGTVPSAIVAGGYAQPHD